MGWVTGFEPATSGATVRRSTAELHPPSSVVLGPSSHGPWFGLVRVGPGPCFGLVVGRPGPWFGLVLGSAWSLVRPGPWSFVSWSLVQPGPWFGCSLVPRLDAELAGSRARTPQRRSVGCLC